MVYCFYSPRWVFFFLSQNLIGASISAVLAGGPIIEHYDPSQSSYDASSVATGAGRAKIGIERMELKFELESIERHPIIRSCSVSIDRLTYFFSLFFFGVCVSELAD